MKKILFISLLSIFLFSGCTNSKEKQIEVLENDGYENIEIKGSAWFGCSDSDSFALSNHFEATKNSNKVEGTLCKGWFKGYTIRIK